MISFLKTFGAAAVVLNLAAFFIGAFGGAVECYHLHLVIALSLVVPLLLEFYYEYEFKEDMNCIQKRGVHEVVDKMIQTN